MQVRQPEGLELPPSELCRVRQGHHQQPLQPGRRHLPALRGEERDREPALRILRRNGGPERQVFRRGVPGTGDDVRRSAQGDRPARRLGQGRRDRREERARHQGAGGLFRRYPAHDRKRHLHRQRHRTRHRQPASSLPRGVFRIQRRAHLLPGEDHPLPRFVGGVRVRPEEPPLREDRPQAKIPGDHLPAGPRPQRRRRNPAHVLHAGHDPVGGQRAVPRPRAGPRRLQGGGRHQGPEGEERSGRQGEEDPRRRLQPARQGGGQGDRHRHGRAGRRPVHFRGDQPGNGRNPGRIQHRGDLAHDRGTGRERDFVARGVLPGARRHRRDHLPDAPEGPYQIAVGRPHRDLPEAASGRPADDRDRDRAFRGDVLRPAQVRFLQGRQAEVQHQAGTEYAARAAHAAGGGLLRRDQLCAEASAQHRDRGRHRSPREPQGARRGRTARKPVPHRARAHGAGDQGEEVGPPGNDDGDAARPHQRQAGDGVDPEFFGSSQLSQFMDQTNPLSRSPTSGACRPWGRAG